jgi:hypothetical protein
LKGIYYKMAMKPAAAKMIKVDSSRQMIDYNGIELEPVGIAPELDRIVNRKDLVDIG